MEEFKNLLQQRETEMKRIIKAAKKTLTYVPDGRLQINRKSDNCIQYYWVLEEGNKRRKYIRKSEIKLTRRLAQKEYAKKVLKLATEYDAKIQKLKNIDPLEEIIQLYKNMSSERQELIEPYILADERFLEMWNENNQTEIDRYVSERKRINRQEDAIIFTDRGEQVRSKSEKIIADKLYRMNIPYCYECPLFLKGYGVVYPDFKVLNVRTRKSYYWEHLGMMKKEDYLRKWINKVETMEKNNIFPGEQLILTYEMEGHPLSTEMLELAIKHYLL